MIRQVIVSVAVALTLASCGRGDSSGAESRTKAQRDSAIANSSLPGAGTVAGAMSAADSAKARQARLDSIVKP